MSTRALSVLGLVLAALAAPGCNNFCCVDPNTGETKLASSPGACGEDFTPVGEVSNNRDEAEVECEVLANGVGTEGPEDLPDLGDPSCADFCELVQSACPEDSACEESCDEFSGDGKPSDDAMECADVAADCAETNGCFSLL